MIHNLNPEYFLSVFNLLWGAHGGAAPTGTRISFIAGDRLGLVEKSKDNKEIHQTETVWLPTIFSKILILVPLGAAPTGLS